MGVLDLMVMMSFTSVCTGFAGVLFINKIHFGFIENFAAVSVSLLVGAGWAWMVHRVNLFGRVKLLKFGSRAKENWFFRGLVGLDFLLVLAGPAIAWTLIPMLKTMNLFR